MGEIELSEEEVKVTIANPDVVTKYKMAAEVANKVLVELTGACAPGAAVLALCKQGDKAIEDGVAPSFKKVKDMVKGIAFPTTISLNNTVGYFCPMNNDPEVTLAMGDMVKIELGVHIDGFAARVGHTFVCGASPAAPVTGRQADVLAAAHFCGEAMLRLIRPGKKSSAVTKHLEDIASIYKCNHIEGTTSFQVSKDNLSDEKRILVNPSEAQKKDKEIREKDYEFQENEVYCVEVVVSTGEGKPKNVDARTSIYKRTDTKYNLKQKASKQVFSEVGNKFGNMAFTVRSLDSEVKARMGIKECLLHNVMVPYDIMEEPKGECVAHVIYTVLLMPNGSLKITSPIFEDQVVKSEYKIEDAELKTLITASVKKSKKKKEKAEPKA